VIGFHEIPSESEVAIGLLVRSAGMEFGAWSEIAVVGAAAAGPLFGSPIANTWITASVIPASGC